MRRFGKEATRDLLLEMRGAVDEIGRVAEDEEIDAQYFRGGQLRVARGPAQLPAIEEAYRSAQALGLEEDLRLLDAEETAGRIRITGAEGGLFNPHCASIHPARLARGLARAVERLGGEIFERTTVTDFEGGSNPKFVTDAGEVRAGAIVLAGEAYLARLRKLRRQVLPIYSLIVLTEPLSQERWSQIGWEGRECVASNRYTVDYLSRTADGRILFGGRGAPYHYGSRIEDQYDRHEPTHEMLRQTAREWFPALEGARFTHAWGGPLAMPRNWMPTMSYDPSEGIATARRLHGAGRGHREPLRPDAGGPDPRSEHRCCQPSHRQPQAALLGARTLALVGRQVRAARPLEGGRSRRADRGAADRQDPGRTPR